MDYHDPVIVRHILLDNFRNPHFKVKTLDDDLSILRIDSPYCIDDITMGLKITNNVVTKAFFMGVGCTISIAAANIICEQITNKEIKEVHLFVQAFSKMLISGQVIEEKILGPSVVFQNTIKQPSRIKCAEVGLNAVKQLINKGGTNE